MAALHLSENMRLSLLLALGVLSGTLGALVLFDARPGINWTVWTVVTIAGLLIYRRPDSAALKALALPLGFAAVLAIGASITTTEILTVFIALIVASLLALALLVAPDESPVRGYGAAYIITAPLNGLARSIGGAVSAIEAVIDASGTTREKPLLRGALIATPFVVILALLFATADPLLARGRDAIFEALTTLDALPRIIFGVLLSLFVVGAYLASQRGSTRGVPAMISISPRARIGLTERRVVLYATAATSWLFVLLQVSYLFATHPANAGSGITFAEYAHRGFGELTIAATGVALLIVAAHQQLLITDEPRAHSALMWPSLALLGAVGCILFSAFHRMSLYEDAYGYTTMRVYAQAYMVLTLAVLAVVGWHVVHDFDVRTLARGVMAVSLSTLVVLVFWNADAWVARANVDRYAQTGKIDVDYLVRGLSPDAYPTLIAALPRLGPVEQQQLRSALVKKFVAESSKRRSAHWYEWNLRRSRATTVQIAAASR